MTVRVLQSWKGTRALIFADGRPSALYTSVCLPTSVEADAADALRALGSPRRR
jgi:hypothetical protein